MCVKAGTWLWAVWAGEGVAEAEEREAVPALYFILKKLQPSPPSPLPV